MIAQSLIGRCYARFAALMPIRQAPPDLAGIGRFDRPAIRIGRRFPPPALQNHAACRRIEIGRATRLSNHTIARAAVRVHRNAKLGCSFFVSRQRPRRIIGVVAHLRVSRCRLSSNRNHRQGQDDRPIPHPTNPLSSDPEIRRSCTGATAFLDPAVAHERKRALAMTTCRPDVLSLPDERGWIHQLRTPFGGRATQSAAAIGCLTRDQHCGAGSDSTLDAPVASAGNVGNLLPHESPCGAGEPH